MNLLFRLIRFLFLLVASVLFNLLLTIFRFLVLPVIIAILGALSNLVFLSILAAVEGPTRFIDRLAAEWTRRLLQRGAPMDHIDQMYGSCRVMVGAMIVLGWIVSTLFTVEILRIVFGLFT